MKQWMERIHHYAREAVVLFGTNLFSNLMALFSTTLVFLFLSLILLGWRTTGHWIGLIRSEAEIQIFQKMADDGKEAGASDVEVLTAVLKEIPGIEEVRYVDAGQAMERMSALMGEGTDVLDQLGENPFRPFLEARIRLEDMDAILSRVSSLASVESVRDNRDILTRLIRLEGTLRLMGLIFGIGVGVFTWVLLAHIIRTGVLYNREQIRTLRLLGAPEFHIAMPFILFGAFLGAGGAWLAAGLSTGALMFLWAGLASPLPFLPIPPRELLQAGLFGLLGGAGLLLGVMGAVSGLSAARHGNDAGHFR